MSEHPTVQELLAAAAQLDRSFAVGAVARLAYLGWPPFAWLTGWSGTPWAAPVVSTIPIRSSPCRSRLRHDRTFAE